MGTGKSAVEYYDAVARATAERLGADEAARREIRKALAFMEPRQLDDSRFRELVVGWWSDADRELEAALPAVPDIAAPVHELIMWCSGILNTDFWRLGRVLGTVHDMYIHGGWAVTAAMVAAGDDAGDFPDWDELVGLTSQTGSLRFADFACAELAALPPDVDRLDAIACPAPGRNLAAAALATAAAWITTERIRTVPARARLDDLFATLEGIDTSAPVAPSAPDTSIDPSTLTGWLEHERAADWTWTAVTAWRHGDPLALGKAIARVSGWPTSILDDIRIAVADQLDDLVALAWQHALAEARGRLTEPRTSPLVHAIVVLADAAAGRAAAELVDTVRAGRDPRPVLGRLLGDPRACPEAWQASAPAIRAALVERS